MSDQSLTNPVVDHNDTYRIGYARQTKPLDLEDPPDRFEPVLELRIPVDADISIIDGTPHFDPVRRDEDSEFVPFPNDPTSGWGDLDGSIDETLTRELNKVFAADDTFVAPSARMLVDIKDPHYERFLDTIDHDDPQTRTFARGYLDRRLDTHELGFDTTGTHANHFLNPHSVARAPAQIMGALLDYLLIGRKALDDICPSGEMYSEVAAIVAEQQAATVVRNSDYPPQYETAATSIHTEIDTRRGSDAAVPAGSVLNTSPQDIFQVLHHQDTPGPALSLARIQSLLELGKYAVFPDLYLAHLLNDLTSSDSDAPAIDDLPHHCSYWEQRSLQQHQQSLNNMRKGRNRAGRILFTTFEAVSLERDRVVRRWWSYDPPRPFNLLAIKNQLFVRRVLNAYQRRCGTSMIPSSHHPTTNEEGTVVYQRRFQQVGVDPFARATTGESSPDQLANLFAVRSREQMFDKAFRNTFRPAVEDLGFDTGEELLQWATS